MTAPRLTEAWDDEDDWTGVSSPAERRKRQNRIHQRAYRKKRHMKRITANNAQAENADGSVTTVATARHPVPEPDLPLVFLENLPIFYVLRCYGIHQNVKEFLQRASTHWTLNLPRPRDLPTITLINAFDALARNALVLGIPAELLESDDGDSLFTLQGPRLPEAAHQTFPGQLAPTALQRTVKHHPWLDLLPIPGMRDNILRGIQAGVLDEDQLCNEIICGLLDLEATSDASLVIWGDAWDVSGWELSPGFFRKWGSLLQGCPEVLQATNHWRQRRGEMKIDFILG